MNGSVEPEKMRVFEQPQHSLSTIREQVLFTADVEKPNAFFDVACVAIFSLLTLLATTLTLKLYVMRIWSQSSSPVIVLGLSASVFLIVITLSWLLADAFSGIVHFLADQILSPSLFFFGSRFVVPFREHHDDPQGLLRHSFFERSGNNCAVSTLLPTLILLHYYCAPAFLSDASIIGLASVCCVYSSALCVAILTAFTNEFHGWAHREHNPPWIQWLQMSGIVLSPKHHDQHHSGNLDSHYCITSGVSERLLWKLKRMCQLPFTYYDS